MRSATFPITSSEHARAERYSLATLDSATLDSSTKDSKHSSVVSIASTSASEPVSNPKIERSSRKERTKPPVTHGRTRFFRSIGLGLFTLLSRKSASKEVRKPVVSKSSTLALSRAAVHCIPCLSSIVMITLNLNHLYLGRSLNGGQQFIVLEGALLQVAAKIQELLMVASLTSVVMHVLRKELLRGRGVPLGVLGSGFMFSSLSYFWSPDFLGSLLGGKISKVAKIRLYSTIAVCGLIAALAGPSTAILMIPRLQFFDAGGAEIYIPGTENSLRPTSLPNENSQLDLCSQQNATEYVVCPSGGYRSMLDLSRTRFRERMYGAMGYSDFEKTGDVYYFSLPTTVNVPSNLDLVPAMALKYNWRPLTCQTGAIGIPLAEAALLGQLHKDWLYTVAHLPYSPSRPSVSEYKYPTSFSVGTSSKIPSVKVACSAAQNQSAGQSNVEFPAFQSGACSSLQHSVDIHNISFKVSPASYTSWISLPASFGALSTGILYEHPLPAADGSRLVVGCSIAAGWSDGTISSSGPVDNVVFNSDTTGPYPWGQVPADRLPYHAYTTDGDHSWQRISLAEEWLRMLTPMATDGKLEGPSTTLDMILDRVGLTAAMQVDGLSATDTWNQDAAEEDHQTVMLERILAHLFADALSREGSSVVFSNTNQSVDTWTLQSYRQNSGFQDRLLAGNSPLLPPDDPLLVNRTATITISGLGFKASEPTDYAAIGLLLAYLLVAIIHTTTILITRRTSDCWDSLTEFFALLHNSSPTQNLLKNTGAGIGTMQTYNHLVQIHAVEPCGTSNGLRAEVYFAKDLDEGDDSDEAMLLSPRQTKTSTEQSSAIGIRAIRRRGEAINVDSLYG